MHEPDGQEQREADHEEAYERDLHDLDVELALADEEFDALLGVDAEAL